MTDRERTARLNADNALDDPGALVALREQMLKWAVLHLGEREAAEDAVQEAFVGGAAQQGFVYTCGGVPNLGVRHPA